MRYLKLALVGLVGGLLLAAAVLTVEFIRAEGVAASQIANCVDVTEGRGFVCSSAVQVGGVIELLTAFTLGFVAAIIWFRRRLSPAIQNT
jgi:hypothetical protein